MTSPARSLADRLRAAADRLTPAERRVADALLANPEAVAFGTVADLAELAGTSGASVVRLATRLGYEGHNELRSAVQSELGRRLRPAAEKIREPRSGDLLGQSLQAALVSVESTITRITADELSSMVTLLAAPRRSVWVIGGDAASGIARQFVTEMSMLRPGVTEICGSPVNVVRQIADVSDDDVLVAIDLRRYDRWVLEATAAAAVSGAVIIALTDGPISPLANSARHIITLEAEGTGPFDNYVGALATLSMLTAGVAASRRVPAAAHLDRIEAAWDKAATLVDDLM